MKKDAIGARVVRGAMLEDLADSGISARHAKKLRLRPMKPDEVLERTELRAPGYEIPYFEPDGRVAQFSRIKMLLPVSGAPDLRYWQEPNSLPRAYLPPLIPKKKWSDILVDSRETLWITEGEKKAACACLHGIPCLGLGGVWSFRSKKAGLSFLPELERANWKGREIRIVFDSDLAHNPDVIRASQALIGELRRRGAASISYVHLHAERNEKIGLDDFIVRHGAEKLTTMTTETHDEMLDRLMEMNTRYMIVDDMVTDQVLRLDTGKFVSVRALTTTREAHNNVIVDNKKVNMGKEWLAWPNRRTCASVTFAPGKSIITEDNRFNRWQGMPYSPKKGDVRPFLDLMRVVVPDRESREWILRWFAYPLRHLGTKMNTAVVVWGPQGSGKSFLGQMIRALYGPYGRYVEQAHMVGQFNDWSLDAQFVIADEIVFHGDRRESNQLKNVITRSEFIVNQKFQPAYTVPDFANYYFTSNHGDALHLEGDDRRYMVVESARKMNLKFYDRIDRWWKTEEARRAVLHYLTCEVSLSGFLPATEPPMTRAKLEMIHESMSSLDQILEGALTNPDSFFALAGRPVERDLWTTEEILAMLPPSLKKTSPAALGKAMSRLKVDKYKLNVPRESGGYDTVRVFTVRNAERWRKAKARELVEHYVRVKISDRQPVQSNVRDIRTARRRRKFDRDEPR